MIAIPAVDLREGACVQLVGGVYDDGARAARRSARRRSPLGASTASAGCTSSISTPRPAAARTATVVRCAARATRRRGARSAAACAIGGAIERLLDAGAARVVVGTRALEDRDWLARDRARLPGRAHRRRRCARPARRHARLGANARDATSRRRRRAERAAARRASSSPRCTARDGCGAPICLMREVIARSTQSRSSPRAGSRRWTTCARSRAAASRPRSSAWRCTRARSIRARSRAEEFAA